MNIRLVREAIATRLGTIPKLRASSTAHRAVYPPAAWVLLPEDITFDKTYGRGSDAILLHVLVLVGKSDAEGSEQLMESYADGSGAQSVKAAVDGDGAPGDPFDYAVVQSVTFGTYTVAENDYLGAEFVVMIVGPGS